MAELMAFKRIQVMHFGTKSWNTISSHLRTTLYFNSIFLFSLADVTAAMSVDKPPAKVFPSAGKKTLFSCKFCKKETYVRSTKAVLSPSCKPRYDSVLVILQLVSSKKLTELLLCKSQFLTLYAEEVTQFLMS